jgi:hypothetical protein
VPSATARDRSGRGCGLGAAARVSAAARSPDRAIEEAAMTTEQNKALVRRFYAEIDAGNVDAMDVLVAADYVDHNLPRFPACRPVATG